MTKQESCVLRRRIEKLRRLMPEPSEGVLNAHQLFEDDVVALRQISEADAEWGQRSEFP
jgi:hypothetical protein